MTIHFLLKQQKRKLKKKLIRLFALQKGPHRRGIIMKLLILAPKKPNSAKRKAAKVGLPTGRFVDVLKRKKKFVNAYISGEGHTLQLFNNVLIRGGRVPDLPGMKYTLVRGVLDFGGVMARRNARSRYGTRFWYTQRQCTYNRYK